MPPKLYWWLVSIGWDNGLVSSGITITWTNVDPDLRGHMASLGYSELIHWYCMIWMDKANMDNGIKRNKKEKKKQVNRLCAYINAHYLLRLHISYTRSNDISTNNGAPISETIDIQNNSRQLWDTPFACLMPIRSHRKISIRTLRYTLNGYHFGQVFQKYIVESKWFCFGSNCVDFLKSAIVGIPLGNGLAPEPMMTKYTHICVTELWRLNQCWTSMDFNVSINEISWWRHQMETFSA